MIKVSRTPSRGQMMIKKFILIAFLAYASVCHSSDLVLDVEIRKHDLMLYLKNTGQKAISVLTNHLSLWTNEGEPIKAELSPIRLVKDGELIKQSISGYFPVILKPGETTWVQYHMIKKSGYSKESKSL